MQVSITGVVEFNGITSGELGAVDPGDAVEITLSLDSNVFVNSPNFPARGYVIDQSSFSMSLGSANVGLQNPFAAGQTPFFSTRNNDPAVDGFLIPTVVDFPVGVPLDVNGVLGPFDLQFLATCGGNTLDSLDILDSLGTYDLTGLTVFEFGIEDGPFQPLGISYEQLTIVPGPGPLGLLASVMVMRRHRRGR